ncbi:subtilisin-like protease [Streptomyces lincolnensis]|uniref:Subtilisin-like protease n=1 Tax=Streptomyces lincolnensis TaxID=1915 RepID=A0A1B1MMB4_STRLN|nr:hypothetical protein [Streptomyces lincolnensis]ANS69718.1 subtilisin-like protease [Streptomyces lincolnensis]AXG58637.1 subtilisin-like protease [Streptomyces lincolnensis]QMV11264.1 hypothetical protein GJU35_40030 [Streptomyces lincolnensis]
MYVSYDRGATWQRTPVHDGRITIRNPAVNRSVSFRADLTDKQGNR